MRYPSAPIFLLGDFNFPAISWEDHPIVTNGSSECLAFLDLCNTFHLSQIVKTPTRVTTSSANVLDLILTTVPDPVSLPTILPGLSDHAVIHFSIPSALPRPLMSYKTIRDYSKADFDAINSELAIFTDSYFPQFWERSIDDNWCLFKDIVKTLTDKYIPLRRLAQHKSPWFNPTLKRLLNKKSAFFAATSVPCRATDYHLISPRLQNTNALSQARNTRFLRKRFLTY